MKKALILLFLVTFSTIFAQENKINWLSIEEVEVLQKKEPRKVFIDVFTTWCGPCKDMMRITFKNNDVINYLNNNFYAVKFDAESGDDLTFKNNLFQNPNFNPNSRRKTTHQFAQALGVNSFPTIIYMDEKMNIIQKVSGLKYPTQYYKDRYGNIRSADPTNQIEFWLKLLTEPNLKEILASEESQKKYLNNFKPTFQ